MRIIAGTAGGRRLKTLAGDNTRPTADRVKEAIFSAVSPFLRGSMVLDAFAGSAALGLEALSRGAGYVWFCERHPAAQKICKENIAACGFDNGELLCGDILSRLPRLRQEQPELVFDIVFLDPPYNSDLILRTTEMLLSLDLLHAESILVAETSAKTGPLEHNLLKITREKKYGDTVVRFYMLK